MRMMSLCDAARRRCWVPLPLPSQNPKTPVRSLDFYFDRFSPIDAAAWNQSLLSSMFHLALFVDVLHLVAQVVPTEFRLQFEDRPGGDIVYALSGMGKVSDLKSKPFVLKEGCSYRLQVTFKTQHEIVTGLKFVNTVTRRTSIQTKRVPRHIAASPVAPTLLCRSSRWVLRSLTTPPCLDLTPRAPIQPLWTFLATSGWSAPAVCLLEATALDGWFSSTMTSCYITRSTLLLKSRKTGLKVDNALLFELCKRNKVDGCATPFVFANYTLNPKPHPYPNSKRNKGKPFHWYGQRV